MKDYKGYKIKMTEAVRYVQDGLDIESDKMFYVAESQFGKSIANQPQQALEGAQEQIDKATK